MACAFCGKEKSKHLDQRHYPDASKRPIVDVYSFDCQVEYLKRGIPTEVVNTHAVGRSKK